jgi:uncharacterized membrane protein HdeD (DUF308 family)
MNDAKSYNDEDFSGSLDEISFSLAKRASVGCFRINRPDLVSKCTITSSNKMKHKLGKAALMFLVSGIVCIAEGLVICLWPDMSFNTLVYLFGFAIILQGAAQFTYGIRRSLENPWMIVLYIGIINIVLGHFLIFYAHLTEFIFIVSIGMTWTTTGFAMLLFAYYLYKETHRDSWLIISGIFSILGGFYVVTHFQKGVIPLLWITVLYDFLFGLTVVLFGVKARAWIRMYDVME